MIVRTMLLCATFFASSGFALESAVANGPRESQTAMISLQVRDQTVRAEIQKTLDKVQARLNAIAACGAQGKYYNESTNQCV